MKTLGLVNTRNVSKIKSQNFSRVAVFVWQSKEQDMTFWLALYRCYIGVSLNYISTTMIVWFSGFVI